MSRNSKIISISLSQEEFKMLSSIVAQGFTASYICRKGIRNFYNEAVEKSIIFPCFDLLTEQEQEAQRKRELEELREAGFVEFDD